MQHRTRLLLAGVAAALAAWPAGAATASEAQAESAKANAFFERVFDENAARSPMFMTQLGMKTDYDKWDDLSEARALEDFELGVKQLAELKRTIRFDLLDDQAKVSYRMFVRDAERAIEGWRWRYHSYPLNQMSGLHADVPAFLINFHRVDNVADARAYIARLRGIAPLLGQLMENAQVRAAKGILPPKFVFGLVIDSCREILAGAPFDASGKKSALLEDIEGKVAALKEADAATKASLLADANAALTGAVKPAYEKLIALLQAQEKVATTDDGVWKLPDGGEFYAYQLRGSTTTNLTAEQIHALGLREVARIHDGMHAIMQQVGFKTGAPAGSAAALQAFFKHIKEDPKYYYPTTPEGKEAYMKRANEIIDAMRARLDEFFTIK
ncbi:MAG TPA: DUF885 domain-containing protein, partial [Lacunisphaera sp.]|nr:DUF885 domain-containing protein [Lacunisphaera sp.]